MSKPKWLLNPKSGAVMACSDLLLKNGKGLVPCKQDGTPLATYDMSEDGVMEAPYLLNPLTGAIMPWSLLLSRKEGLIPCDDQDHANRILLNLGKDELVSGPVSEPESTEETETAVGLYDDEPETSFDADPEPEQEEEERGTVIDEMADIEIPPHIDAMTNKKDLVKYAKDNFDEKLDLRVNITMLKEQVALLELQNAQDQDDLSMVTMA